MANKYLKFEYWNTCDLGNIYYQGGQHFWFFLDGDVGEPFYEEVEDGQENGDGDFVPTYRRQIKKYLIKSSLVPDYLVDAMKRMELHDNIELTWKTGEVEQIYNVSVEPEWQFEKYCHQATVTITFDMDEKITVGACCDNLTVGEVVPPEPIPDLYWVAETGSDVSGDGSYANPWATFGYASTQATVSGDVIHMKAGTITETVQSSFSLGVSVIGQGDTSIIKAGAALNPIFKFASLAQGTNGNQSISYLKFDGDLIAIVGIGVYARSNVIVHHCTFVDTDSYGAYFTGLVSGSGAPATYAIGNSVYNCTFTNCAKDTLSGGVYTATGSLAIGGQSGMLVYDNNIDESYGRHGYGIKYCGDGYNKGLKIYNNIIEIDPGRGVANSWAFAIELWSQRGGIEIYNNTITSGSIDIAGYDTNDTGGYGFAVRIYDNTISWGSLVGYDEKAIYLELSVTGGVYIYRNYFHNVPTVLAMYPYDGDTIEDVYFYYNICNEIRQSGAGYTGRITLINAVTGSVIYDNLQFINNTIYNSTQTIGSAFHFNTDNATITNIIVNNNIINNAYNPIRFEESDVDIVSFQNNNTYGCHHNNITYFNSTGTNVTEANNSLITDDPLFVTPGSDFHLQVGSPCINAGTTPLLSTVDYDLIEVDVPVEMGVYEYV
jgi:hypothetical protein